MKRDEHPKTVSLNDFESFAQRDVENHLQAIVNTRDLNNLIIGPGVLQYAITMAKTQMFCCENRSFWKLWQ